MTAPHLLCLGFGYSARPAAARMAARGWAVTGTARSAEGAAGIAALGHRGIVFDGAAPSGPLAAAIAGTTDLLVSVPPGRADPVLMHHTDDIARAPTLQSIVYLSTIGVYGDAGGAWVDETTPARPTSERSKERLAAEDAWTALAARGSCRIVVLRLAGIYGPGRSAIDSVKAGTARRIVKQGQVFNRIHVTDIASAIEAALLHPTAAGLYNVADDEPAPPQDVIAHAARLLGVPPPPEIPFETVELSPMAASFYAESKRAANARLKRELVPKLEFPTYREGLAHILTHS